MGFKISDSKRNLGFHDLRIWYLARMYIIPALTLNVSFLSQKFQKQMQVSSTAQYRPSEFSCFYLNFII